MMDWRSALISQAASDYQVALLLKTTRNLPLCHTLHYLQMSLEKFARGLMSPPGSMAEPPHSHEGAVKLVQFLKYEHPHTQAFRTNLGMGKMQRISYLDGQLTAVQSLERLAPALAKKFGTGINAEYPWSLHHTPGVIHAVLSPVSYDFTSYISPTKLERVFQLVNILVRSYPS